MNRRNALISIAAASSLIESVNSSANTGVAARSNKSTPQLLQGFLDTEYGSIYYWSVGTGPNVLCVHQSGNSSQEYMSLIPILEGRCRLIALDLPGCGLSADPESEPSVEDYTIATQRVLDHLKIEKAHIVGHHGGALTAMNLAAKTPERFDKLILSGTGGLKTPEQTQEFVDSLTSVDTSIRADTSFIAGTWERYLGFMSDGSEVIDIVKPFMAFLDSRLKPYRGVLINLKWDRRAALNKLRGPVLLVQGGKDQYVSGQASLLKIIPNSSRLEMPGCGTFMFYDKPKECAQMMIDYLEL